MVHSRHDIMKRFRAKIAAGQPIIGGGAGTGISAKCEEGGGIDLIIVYNSGRYRMAGRGSMCGLMPYGNANQMTKDMGFEVLTVVKDTPVLAGVCATDPFMLRDLFLQELKTMGFAGVQNFPTVGLIDGTFRMNLEEVGITYDAEIEMVARAHELDLLTTPYVFDAQQARQMTRAGADLVVAHMGLTVSGSIGAKTSRSLDQSVKEISIIAEAAKSERGDVIVICHGGPLASPEDAQYVMDRSPLVDGFYGASSIERLPTEIALTEQVRKFTRLTLGKRTPAVPTRSAARR
jgi:predicted TIM-barrel enzyme